MPAFTFRSYTTMMHSVEHLCQCHRHEQHPFRGRSSPSQDAQASLPALLEIEPDETSESSFQSCHRRQKARRRRVHFQEEFNEYHHNESMTSLECKDLWYDRTDYANFKRDAANALEAVSQNRVFFLWAKKLTRAYESYGFVTAPEEVRAIRRRDKEHFPVELVGLEKLILCALLKTLEMTRQQLYREVNYWQQYDNVDHRRVQDEIFRSACCRVSQQSKLWAQHTARLAIQSQLNVRFCD